MKTIQLVVRVEVPDKTSPKRVQKLTETLLDIGLNYAAETLEMESDGGPPSQNIRDAKAVTDWNFHTPEFMCEACGRPAAKLVSAARSAVDGGGRWWICHKCASVKGATPDNEVKDAVEGGPWACECDNTHAANHTVCRYCREVLGRRKPGSPMPRRIVALFQPRALVNGDYADTGPAIPVDVTDVVLEIGEKDARTIEDDDHPSDGLMPASLLDWNKAKNGANAAFRVTVEKAINEYFEKNDSPT